MEEIDSFIQRALASTLDDSLTLNDLIALTMETGKYGVEGMAHFGPGKHTGLRKSKNQQGKTWCQ